MNASKSYYAASENAAAQRRKKLGYGILVAYGSGAIVDSVLLTALSTFLFFYLTAVSGLSNSLAGLALFIGLIVDAISDPFVGSLSDNTTTKLGRRHPYMFGTLIPLGVMLGVLFSIPAGLSGWGLFAFVTIVLLGLRFCHSFWNLPYIALGAELSDDYNERTVIVASRFLFSVVGSMACMALGTRVFMGGPEGLLERSAYAPFGWTSGGIIVICGLAASVGTLRAIKRLHRAPKRVGSVVKRFLADMVEIFRNPSFVTLFATVLLTTTGGGATGVLVLHAYQYFWKLPPEQIQYVLLSGPSGVFLGTLACLFLAKFIEKRTMVFYGLISYLVFISVPPLLYISGVLPKGNIALLAILMSVAALVGGATAAIGIGFQSALADAADEHENLFGTRREGLFFAGLNFSAQAAVGLGSLFAGVGLDLIDFPTNIAAKGAANISIDAATADRLGVLYGPVPAVLTAISALIFLRYRHTRITHARILMELEQRRAIDQSGAALAPEEV